MTAGRLETVPFEKYHGTGNDFVVVEGDAPVPDRRTFAIAHCDRESGVGADRADVRTVGADGVLFLDLDSDATPPLVRMAHYQPDGSTAEMCGNGARCAALWGARRLDTDVDELLIDTPAGIRRATIGDEISIEMGTPSFDPVDVPLDRDEPLIDEELHGFGVTAVNTGVPHAVTFVDDVDVVDLDEVAPPIRHAAVFPEGSNVTFASKQGDGFEQRTFERGVEGETLACGTGAVAIVAVAKRVGLLERTGPVTVSPPGGDLSVAVPDGAAATLRGPARFEYCGDLPTDPDVSA